MADKTSAGPIIDDVRVGIRLERKKRRDVLETKIFLSASFLEKKTGMRLLDRSRIPAVTCLLSGSGLFCLRGSEAQRRGVSKEGSVLGEGEKGGKKRKDGEKEQGRGRTEEPNEILLLGVEAGGTGRG